MFYSLSFIGGREPYLWGGEETQCSSCKRCWLDCFAAMTGNEKGIEGRGRTEKKGGFSVKSVGGQVLPCEPHPATPKPQ